MPRYYAALRFWPGFPRPIENWQCRFPYERFDLLDDAQLEAELNRFAESLARNPVVDRIENRRQMPANLPPAQPIPERNPNAPVPPKVSVSWSSVRALVDAWRNNVATDAQMNDRDAFANWAQAVCERKFRVWHKYGQLDKMLDWWPWQLQRCLVAAGALPKPIEPRLAPICVIGQEQGWWFPCRYWAEAGDESGLIPATSRRLLFAERPADTFDHARLLATALAAALDDVLKYELSAGITQNEWLIDMNPRFSVATVDTSLPGDHLTSDVLPLPSHKGDWRSKGYQAASKLLQPLLRSYQWPLLQIVPKWNRTTRELTYGGDLAKQVGKSQIATAKYPLILDAFEAAGWPPSIQNPITGNIDPKGQLQDLISALNASLRLLRFGGVNNVVSWMPVPK